MEFSTDKPIYKQIIDYGFGCILTGRWRPREKIPSVRELSVDLTVNSHTVLKAYEYLQVNDIITPRRGMGFYLTSEAVSKVNDLRRKEFFDSTLCDIFKEMTLLDIPIEEIVARFRKWNERKDAPQP